MDPFAANRHIDSRQDFIAQFIRKFSEPDVQAAARAAAQEMFGYDEKTCDVIAAQMTAALDDIDKRPQLTLFFVIVLQCARIETLTQVALKMDAIPRSMIPTYEDLDALRVAKEFGEEQVVNM